VEAVDKPLPIELELMAEKASSLALATSKLEQALAALAAADQALQAAPRDEKKRATRANLRAEASRRLWYLIVQREAIGLRSHEDVLRFYRVPPELRAYAGR
jgi:hypothetical protein